MIRLLGKRGLLAIVLVTAALMSGCFLFESGNSASETSAEDEGDGDAAEPGRIVIFIGVDISGSFKKTGYFKDSIRFAAHYIYAHLKGYGGLEVPSDLFVGSIGGVKPNE